MQVEGFEWDSGNEDKIAERFDSDEIESLIEGRYTVIRNKRSGSGTHRLMGRSYTGRLITVVVSPTAQPGIWRPISAWLSDAEERRHAERAGIL